MDLESLFGSRMQTRLLKYLLDNPGRVFNQAGLARFLDCSPSTVARLTEPLIKEGILAFEQLSGQMKVLALNTESEKVMVILEFYGKIRKL
jgi:DNA-binding MarR family transcriptional regulator